MTGKLADTVMSVRNGEQIARKYQPVVFNPSTPAQVANRAKLKALSQLSAVMAPVIAMPKQGSVSSRNLFTKVNFPAVTYSSDQASVALTSVKLTQSALSLPETEVTFGTSEINVSLRPSSFLDVDRVVYVAFRKMDDNALRLAGSVSVSTAGEVNNYAGTISVDSVEVPYVVYAYGIRDNSENARITFGNISVPTAEMIAQLIVSRNLTEKDISLTETRSALITPGA